MCNVEVCVLLCDAAVISACRREKQVCQSWSQFKVVNQDVPN